MRAFVLIAFSVAVLRVAALSLPSEVAALPRNEARAGMDCSVTGVVTMVANWQPNAFIVADEDDPNGPGVYVTSGSAKTVAPGDVVAIDGRTTESFLSNAIRAVGVERLRRVEMPSAPDASLAALHRGLGNMRRVRLRGTVQRVARSERAENLVTLRIGTAEGPFDAHIAGDDERWISLVDSDVEVSGVAFALYTLRWEFIGMQIEVSSPDDVRVVAGAAGDPFLLPETDLDRVLLFYAHDSPDTHARHVRGIVTCIVPGEAFCLQGNSGAMWARVVGDIEMPAVGDEVDVVGFTDIVNSDGEFDVWKLRIRRSGAELPDAIGLEDLKLFDTVESPDVGFNGLSGYRVRIRGKLVGMLRREGCADEIAVQVPDGIVQVVLAGRAPAALVELERHEPVVEASGVVQLSFRRGLQRLLIPRIASITVRASVPSDIVVVDRGRYDAYRRSRLCWTILGGFVAMVLMVLMLRIVRDLRRRRRLEAVIAERKRMSMDLHDTIEQNLAVSSMILNSSLLGDGEVPSDVRRAVHDVSEMLMQTKRDIRSIIMNLRNDELFDKSPAEVLRNLAAALSKPGVVRVRTLFRGMPQHLDGHVLADIVCVVQEAVSNAIRHGHASAVLIASDPTEDGFTLSVANNGEPFDPATAPGVAEGHFGLSGMRTRAKRGGFTIEFGMKGSLTVVRLSVPFKA